MYLSSLFSVSFQSDMMETVNRHLLSNYSFLFHTPVYNVGGTQRAVVDLPEPDGEGAVSIGFSKAPCGPKVLRTAALTQTKTSENRGF